MSLHAISPATFTPQQKRRRLLALGVVVVAYMLSFFQRFAPAGIAQDLAAAFQTSAASLGVLAATYFYVYTVMQVPTGILVDTLGPRRILLLGGIVGGIGSLVFGLAEQMWLALIGRALIGLGVSVTFIAMLKIIAVWFEEHRFATVVGVAMLIGNLGSVLAGAPLSWLAQIANWRTVFLGVAVLSFLLAALCWLIVRDRVDDLATPNAPKVRFDRTVILTSLLSVMRNPAIWPPALVCYGICGSFFTFAGLWATPWLTQVHGFSRGEASTHLSLYFFGFAIGCVLMGSLSDRLRQRKPVLIAATHSYALFWVFILCNITLPLWASYAVFAAMGVSTAGFTLTWACAKEVSQPTLSGMATSVANMGAFLCAAILQPLVGWVMDQLWQGTVNAAGVRIYDPQTFRWGLSLVALLAWSGAAYVWKIQETGCRNIWQANKGSSNGNKR